LRRHAGGGGLDAGNGNDGFAAQQLQPGDAAPAQVGGGSQQQGDGQQERRLLRPPLRIAESGHERLPARVLVMGRRGPTLGESSIDGRSEAASQSLQWLGTGRRGLLKKMV